MLNVHTVLPDRIDGAADDSPHCRFQYTPAADRKPPESADGRHGGYDGGVMAPEPIFELLSLEHRAAVTGVVADGLLPHVVIHPSHWSAIARFLRDDPRTGLDWLRCISAVDLFEKQQFELIYELHATQPGATPQAHWTIRRELTVKVRVPRDQPVLPSVAAVWPAADWHEREAHDLMGVVFEGHPNLRRILCCDDWVGHPLRKDYEFPLEYHGIPAVTEFAQSRPQH